MTTPAFAPADLVLLVLLVVGLPLRSWFSMQRLRAAAPGEIATLRPRLWLRAIVTQWLIASAVVLQWIVQRRPLESLSLNARFEWGAAGVLLGVVLIAILQHSQRRDLATTPDVVARVRARLAGVARLLPESRGEWWKFVPLALTAGICEELLFRGFLTWLLAQVLPEFWQAALVQSLAFGLAHAYQGPRGVFLTFMVGAFLTGVVWITGSLWPAMLVHALLDLNAGDFAVRLAAIPVARSAPAA